MKLFFFLNNNTFCYLNRSSRHWRQPAIAVSKRNRARDQRKKLCFSTNLESIDKKWSKNLLNKIQNNKIRKSFRSYSWSYNQCGAVRWMIYCKVKIKWYQLISYKSTGTRVLCAVSYCWIDFISWSCTLTALETRKRRNRII